MAAPEHELEKQGPGSEADMVKNGHVPEKVWAHSNDADEAMKAFQGHEGELIEIDEATNKRLLRRIDWNLMPVSVQLLASNDFIERNRADGS